MLCCDVMCVCVHLRVFVWKITDRVRVMITVRVRAVVCAVLRVSESA